MDELVEHKLRAKCFPRVLASPETMSRVPLLFWLRGRDDVKKSWEGYERSTAVLLSETLVMSVYSPTSDYDVAFDEIAMGQVRSVLWSGW